MNFADADTPIKADSATMSNPSGTKMGFGLPLYTGDHGKPSGTITPGCGLQDFIITEAAVRADRFSDNERCIIRLHSISGKREIIFRSGNAGFGDRRLIHVKVQPREFLSIEWINCLPRTTVHAAFKGYVE